MNDIEGSLHLKYHKINTGSNSELFLRRNLFFTRYVLDKTFTFNIIIIAGS